MTPLQRALYRTSLVVIAMAAAAGIALLLLNEPPPEGVRLVTELASDTAPLPTPTATALFAADIEHEAELALLDARAPVDVDVLRVANQGSATSSFPELFSAASPLTRSSP